MRTTGFVLLLLVMVVLAVLDGYLPTAMAYERAFNSNQAVTDLFRRRDAEDELVNMIDFVCLLDAGRNDKLRSRLNSIINSYLMNPGIYGLRPPLLKSADWDDAVSRSIIELAVHRVQYPVPDTDPFVTNLLQRALDMHQAKLDQPLDKEQP
jgi:hypothetical protein